MHQTQEHEKAVIEIADKLRKAGCKDVSTNYDILIKEHGGKVVKLGEKGTIFDSCIDICNLPEGVKSKLTNEIIKIIEINEAEKQEKKEE